MNVCVYGRIAIDASLVTYESYFFYFLQFLNELREMCIFCMYMYEKKNTMIDKSDEDG